jgi:hypothetical protein
VYVRGPGGEDLSPVVSKARAALGRPPSVHKALTTPTLSPTQVTFGLHPSFAQAQRVCTRPPYEVTETGWGEFDITITVSLTCASAAQPGWEGPHPPCLCCLQTSQL